MCVTSGRKLCSRAFTLLEVLLSILIVVAAVFFGKRLVGTMSENAKSIEETKIIDSGMHALMTLMRADLGSIVMARGQQPVFEIHENDRRKGIEIFFLTTNDDEHVTTAVKYDIAEPEFGHIEVTRTALNKEMTIALQSAMGSHSSFGKFFENAAPSVKRTHTFGLLLSDFKIRAGVKKYDGSIVSTYPNSKVAYVGGNLICERATRKSTIPCDLLFFDVTVRSFAKSDAAKFDHIKAKDLAKAREFLFQRSRRSFARITINSSSFS
ncbi:MAG: hypothetical protein LBT64_03180 [Puniceicoccales bacterium]|jgi:hypothetical protein|nr:hypothetical protein [Puniceicoccales bacterium]